MTNYVLQCVDCSRPAQMISEKKIDKPSHVEVKKVYEKVCPCGGAIKPMID